MSIFNWFGSQKSGKKHARPGRSGAAPDEATRPQPAADAARSKPTGPANAAPVAPPKTERPAQRELLHEVVRDAMLRAGVLGARYKFKVLSLDGRGSPYLILIDLADPLAGGAARLTEIEATMAQTAKQRHAILITAVYWRMSEQVTAGLAPKERARPAPLQEEVAAFKRASASSAPGAAPSAADQIVSAPPPVDFQDTQMMDSEQRPATPRRTHTGI